MSPTIVDFFQNSFNKTRFTNNVRNLDWKLGETLSVIGQERSIITQELADKLINDGKPEASESEEVQNRQVVTEMLKLDWLRAGFRGKEKAGFQDFIVALANAPHESLFSTDLIITLVEHFWDYFYKRIFLMCFIPYIIYFCSTIYYVSNYPRTGILEEERWALTTEFFLRWIILASVLYFAFFEIVTMTRDGMDYWFDIYNYFDWTAFTLNFYVVFHIMYNNRTPEDSPETLESSRATLRSLCALLAFLMWVKSFYWMRLF